MAFSRRDAREIWKRRVVTDNWVENRNCDLEGIHEWCGYTFFYVKFGPQHEDPAGRTQGPIPPPGSVSSIRGYGSTEAHRSRAGERGRSVMHAEGRAADGDGTAYDGSAISARGSVSLEGGPMTGYELRLQGCEQRGELEVDSGQAAWTQSLTWEGLLQLPCWMGIATVPSPPPRLERHEEDSESDGSFEVMTSGG